MKADIKRIEKMEAYLDECHELNAQLALILEKLDENRNDMIRLFDYYGSKRWFADREAEIPKDVKAGVLSEDLVYDEISTLRDNAFHMLESATDILKNRI